MWPATQIFAVHHINYIFDHIVYKGEKKKTLLNEGLFIYLLICLLSNAQPLDSGPARLMGPTKWRDGSTLPGFEPRFLLCGPGQLR